MPVFVILNGPDAGRELVVKPGAGLILGRGEDTAIQIPDKNVSRHHARLTWCEGLPTMVDLGSSNGTLVNGLPINQIALLDGDEIQMGETRVRYVSAGGTPIKKKGTGGLRLGTASGNVRAVVPKDATTVSFQVPAPSMQMDALYDTYNKLKSLYRGLQSFSSAKSAEELVHIAADSILLAVPCERVAIFLTDESGKMSPAHQTWRDDIQSNQRERLGSVDPDLLEEMNRKRAPMFFVPSLDDGSTPPPETDASLIPPSGPAQSVVRSSPVIGAPILEGRSLRGMILVDTPISHRLLSKNDLDLVATLALQMAEPLTRLQQIERLEQTQSGMTESSRDGLAIITRSPAMQPILQMVRQVAPTEATVLVIGESGTGKELMARSIHNLSQRRDRPMVCVNCAALPEGLIESELFGHEKGAFTGAFTRRPGKFEAADGGTIFLDEIGELPMTAQSKLLRVLQEGEIQRIGSTTPITVDVRVIAATNVALEAAVKANRFREDLYYRIHVVEISVPPLRQRFQDIGILAQFYLETFRKKIPTAVRSISPEALAAMTHYPWPGNVRELRNVIERAIVLATGTMIHIGDLPAEIGAAGRSANPDMGSDRDSGDRHVFSPDDTPGIQGVSSLADVEKRHIMAVLDIVKGNKVKAARLLGISRTTLYEKIKSYALEP